MELNEKDIKKLIAIFLILSLAILVFILVRPILLAIIWGLILAYIFFPVYRKVLQVIKRPNLAAFLICILVILLIVIPLYFFVPLIIGQAFDVFQYIQKLDMKSFIKVILPSAPEQFIIQVTLTLDSLISKFTSGILGGLADFLLEVPTLLFNLVIIAFVFFFTLRDSEKLAGFVSALSPLNRIQEKELVKQFKDITNSVIFGQILIGLAQGIMAGIGFFIFGVPHALVLTLLAILFSIIPILGAFFVWIPAAVYLFLQGNVPFAIIYLIYNIILVSNIDNLLRIYIVAKKTNLSQVIVLIGMVGGLFIFGILGLILGPLLLAYFITLLQAYKNNALFSLFKEEKKENA